MEDYDIGKAFEKIEDELMASMIRNMSRHRAEETERGYEWSAWQAEQLKTLEEYKRSNEEKYKAQFKSINAKIAGLIRAARQEGGMEQEQAILNAIRNGYTGYKKAAKGMSAQFFRLNDKKLEALIKATTDDMKKAETAILRMANDKYRKAIFNAAVYANTGAGTYEKAVDMATKDMLAAGLNCVEYSNGTRHTLKDYADMALRTASKRAYLQGEGEKRMKWGISTVILNKRGDNPCPKCLPFVGKVLIDDVWSGGTRKEAEETGYKLMSEAIAAGLYHPRCRDKHTTYFEGISTPPDDKYTKAELQDIEKENQREARQQYVARQKEKYHRLGKYSLDEENRRIYRVRSKEWENQMDKTNQSDILEVENAKEVTEVHLVGKINKEIYKCITDDIITDEVVITDNQIRHIKQRHPESYQKLMDSMKMALADPDFIIEDKHKNTGLVVKKLDDQDGHTQMVLRISTSEDEPGYKNSIISSWEISEKRLQNYLRNKTILYKKE